jgi:hypothetical protein
MKAATVLPYMMMRLINQPLFYPEVGYTSPIYIPKKHTIKSYRTQQKEGRK